MLAEGATRRRKWIDHKIPERFWTRRPQVRQTMVVRNRYKRGCPEVLRDQRNPPILSFSPGDQKTPPHSPEEENT